jgi:hypothetical protein
VNPLASGRRSLAKEFAKHDIEVNCDLFSVSVLYVMLTIICRRFSSSHGAMTRRSLRRMSVESRFRLPM